MKFNTKPYDVYIIIDQETGQKLINEYYFCKKSAEYMASVFQFENAIIEAICVTNCS